MTTTIRRLAHAGASLVVMCVGSTLPARAQEHAPVEQTHTPAAAATDAPLSQRGTGEFVTPPPAAPTPQAASPDEPRLEIRFEQAPIAIVVETLLSDFANASVVIDPRVSGDITIRSEGQLTAREVPEFLRSSLAALGLDLVAQGERAYTLRPLSATVDAPGAEVFRPGASLQGGMVIYGLRHVAANEMARLLAPFARNGVTVQPERTRELLFITGPADQVQGLLRTIELLDVDWLTGMSFAIVPLQHSSPEALIGEMRTLFGGADGPIGSMIEFVPLPQRQAILLLAKRPDRLDQARNWIQQLDRAPQGGGRVRFLQIANADATHIAETLTALFGDGQGAARITADATRNALLIQSDPGAFEEIAALVRDLDRPIDQVMIEVTIAEITLNNDFRFGVQWSFDLRDGSIVTLSDTQSGAVVAEFPGFAGTFSGSYVRAALNALSSRTHVEVISSPVIVTLDNQEAVLQVGDEVPIVTQSTANVTTSDPTVINTVQYRETGILLRVKPRIGANGAVTLEVTQEASEVAATTTSGIDSPTIQQRRFESTVSVSDGETIALGGLIRANRTRGRSGLPILSDIPLLGAPFRNTNTAVRRTELVVFLTPRILRTANDARAASHDLEQRLDRIRASRFIQQTRD